MTDKKVQGKIEPKPRFERKPGDIVCYVEGKEDLKIVIKKSWMSLNPK